MKNIEFANIKLNKYENRRLKFIIQSGNIDDLKNVIDGDEFCRKDIIKMIYIQICDIKNTIGEEIFQKFIGFIIRKLDFERRRNEFEDEDDEDEDDEDDDLEYEGDEEDDDEEDDEEDDEDDDEDEEDDEDDDEDEEDDEDDDEDE